MLIKIIKSPCVSSIINFESAVFYILTHGTVYNLLQVENYGEYMSLYQVSRRKTSEYYFVYESNHTALGSLALGLASQESSPMTDRCAIYVPIPGQLFRI